ncbi:DNA polymerase Ligase (LigD) [uncultured archaeon]|nr:DNA polymerase Ligase (LigD) [uncultured archaeon]
MSLELYKSKRDLKKSNEPSAVSTNSKGRLSEGNRLGVRAGKIKKSSDKKLIYIIHEHHATHLHWDLRLEMEGVLKSWAVPKIPPKEKNEKRLAIQVEDHPIEYAKFHGIIPEGNYGAGEVKIWDKGNYELIEKNPKKIIIEIHGKKLKGKYCLIKTNYENKKSWLFFKL